MSDFQMGFLPLSPPPEFKVTALFLGTYKQSGKVISIIYMEGPLTQNRRWARV